MVGTALNDRLVEREPRLAPVLVVIAEQAGDDGEVEVARGQEHLAAAASDDLGQRVQQLDRQREAAAVRREPRRAGQEFFLAHPALVPGQEEHPTAGQAGQVLQQHRIAATGKANTVSSSRPAYAWSTAFQSGSL